jgi:hypothetical protein
MIKALTDIRSRARLRCRVVVQSDHTPPGLGHRAPHFGVFSHGGRFLTLFTVGDPLQPFPLTLLCHSLAFVGAALSVIRHQLAFVSDSVALVGDTFAFVRDVLAAINLDLAQRQRLCTLVVAAGDHAPIKRLMPADSAVSSHLRYNLFNCDYVNDPRVICSGRARRPNRLRRGRVATGKRGR